ncbi:hypothetical protein B484DRAFT_409812 [Ochromonadaceae sp. CCMP2298]|nr:hypothetical protein B484DRAFT_409812 [Ochromonadaceae sp. CCMP2298]
MVGGSKPLPLFLLRVIKESHNIASFEEWMDLQDLLDEEELRGALGFLGKFIDFPDPKEWLVRAPLVEQADLRCSSAPYAIAVPFDHIIHTHLMLTKQWFVIAENSKISSSYIEEMAAGSSVKARRLAKERDQRDKMSVTARKHFSDMMRSTQTSLDKLARAVQDTADRHKTERLESESLHKEELRLLRAELQTAQETRGIPLFS